VTLGRALLQLGRLAEAREELEIVLQTSPENLAAVRGLAEIHHQQGALPEAITTYERALMLAPNDPELERAVTELNQALARSLNTTDREQARRELAVMEQWLLAIHVSRAQSLS